MVVSPFVVAVVLFIITIQKTNQKNRQPVIKFLLGLNLNPKMPGNKIDSVLSRAVSHQNHHPIKHDMTILLKDYSFVSALCLSPSEILN